MRDMMPLKFHNSSIATSVRTPMGLPESIEKILNHVHETKGVRISRNSFILKAIRHYIDFLMTSKDIDEMLTRIHVTKTE